MIGNVWKWNQDTYGNYSETSKNGSAYGSKGDKKAKLLRGGSWGNQPDFARSAYRYRYVAAKQLGSNGFRVVAVLLRTE